MESKKELQEILGQLQCLKDSPLQGLMEMAQSMLNNGS